jgi:nickel/cobalt exporter
MTLLTRALLLCLLALAVLAPSAGAHPLGNFTINHLARVSISDDRVDVHYILDQAEIPTFQERQLTDAQILQRKQAEIVEGLQLFVDGRRVQLRPQPGAELTHPDGQGGLKTTRLELRLSAPVSDPRRVRLRDETFADRAGWKAIAADPGEGTQVRSSVPSADPTNGLRSYPQALAESPRDVREATFSVEPGRGALTAPADHGEEELTTTRSGGADGFAGVFDDAAAGEGVLAFLLLSAFAWGALHALSPGHGKAMVAAYLVGARGTARHAVALGGVVTITHTIGVFALGIVTLALAEYVVPEDIYPWLTLVSGLLVVVIGAGVLRSRLRARRATAAGAHGHWHAEHDYEDDGHRHDNGHGHAHAHAPDHARHGPSDDHAHDHHHDHDHDHAHHHAHAHDHDHHHDHHHAHDHHHGHDHGHSHGHGHHHHMPESLSWRGVLGMGAAAGLIPCPSALVVLLGAIAQHQVALGLLLIVAFSVGLAGTLTVLGLLVVRSRGLADRLRIPKWVTVALPASSAVVIIVAGCVLTLSALPQIVS